MKTPTFLKISIALCLLLFILPLQAEVKLPAIVSSNMVLQRNTTVIIWGWADSKEKITIETTWLDEHLKIQADKDGNWRAEIKTTNDKSAQKISIRSKDSDIVLENILFGEVWICSGQSNMQQSVNGYRGQPTFGNKEALLNSRNAELRLFFVDRVGSKTPKKDLEKYTGWEEASSDNVGNFSAVAYYFGSQLQEFLDVPVGLIHTSWGGSSVQAWISKEVMDTYEKVNLDTLDITKRTQRIPTALYNGMIEPLIPYTFKGALWYQGESNRLEPEKYKKLFPAMVKDWRTRWDIGEFPFYFVQIAPYWYGDNEIYSDIKNSAFIREAQLQCADLIPNSGIAITMDIGDEYFIHPPKKKEVADRLLFNALNQTYGFKGIDGKSPAYDSMEAKDGGLLLSFKNAESGLYSFGELTGFEIASEDQVFYPASAKIVAGKDVMVQSDLVITPVAVRYAWKNWIEGTLFDTNLLPASSFRTDNWNDATQFKAATIE